MPITTSAEFVAWFRSVAPYINAFRGRTFVIAFGGEVVADGKFVELTHDFNLLASLGIRLVLVHGARPQIEQHLAKNNIEGTYPPPHLHRGAAGHSAHRHRGQQNGPRGLERRAFPGNPRSV